MEEKSTIETSEQERNEKLAQVKDRLDARGINDIEVGEKEVLDLDILSMAQSEDLKEDTARVMNELGMEEETQIAIERRTVRFKEKVDEGPIAAVFPDRKEEQEFTLYTFPPKEDYVDQESPIVLFSHGGTIRPETSLKSPFLAVVREQAERSGHPLILATLDHRGSSSDEEKVDYSLEDRVADLEVGLATALEKAVDEYAQKGVKWNGKIVLIGNSMGGHVVAAASDEIEANSVVLPQPAAYSEEAHTAPFGEGFTTAIRRKDSWKLSPAFPALERHLERGGRALIIGAKEDEVIPDTVTRRYMKEVTFHYATHAARTEGEESHFTGLMWIPEVHTRTTPDEINAIVESCVN